VRCLLVTLSSRANSPERLSYGVSFGAKPGAERKLYDAIESELEQSNSRPGGASPLAKKTDIRPVLLQSDVELDHELRALFQVFDTPKEDWIRVCPRCPASLLARRRVLTSAKHHKAFRRLQLLLVGNATERGLTKHLLMLRNYLADNIKDLRARTFNHSLILHRCSP
jgi:hypothetical protein